MSNLVAYCKEVGGWRLLAIGNTDFWPQLTRKKRKMLKEWTVVFLEYSGSIGLTWSHGNDAFGQYQSVVTEKLWIYT